MHSACLIISSQRVFGYVLKQCTLTEIVAPRAILITAIAVTFTLVVVLLSAVIESILPAIVITSFPLTTVIGSLLTAAIASLVLLLPFYMFFLPPSSHVFFLPPSLQLRD